jgi:CTP synthase
MSAAERTEESLAAEGSAADTPGDLGGTMRLGAYSVLLQRGSRVSEIYSATEISERHRHRYEVNTNYKGRLEQHGMRFSGMSPDSLLPEMIEYENHPGSWACSFILS